MYYSKKIEKLYRVSLMALAIGLFSAVFSPAQALLPPGSNDPSKSPAFPNTETGAPAGMPIFKDGVAIPTPSGGMITPSDGPNTSMTKGTEPTGNNKGATVPKTQVNSDTLVPASGINASSGGLPSINQDNPLFVKPQAKVETPSAPQKEEDILSFLKAERSRRHCAVLCYSEELPLVGGENILDIGRAEDLETQAKNLFTALRMADKLDVEVIYAHLPPQDGIGLALYNRMIRAAAHTIRKV